MHTLLIPLLAFACKEPIPRSGDANTASDEDCQQSSWYADSDQDLYGAGAAVMACTAPPGHVDRDGDCDDTDPFRYPSALEVCDGGLDNDCDGLADDADDSLDPSLTQLWFADHDGDGFGDFVEGVEACLAPEGFVADAQDCDDTDPTVNPSAPEVCEDGVDNDCSGDAPECVLSGSLSMAELDVAIRGRQLEGLGTQVVLLDSDGDGDLELAASGPGASDGGPTQGRIYLFTDPTGAYSSSADAAWESPFGGADSVWGDSLSTLSDPWGEGYDGLVIGGTPRNNAERQEVALFFGGASGLGSRADVVLTGADGTLFGTTHRATESGLAIAAPLSSAGDRNGGAVFLWHSIPTRDAKDQDADWVVTGSDAGLLGYLGGVAAGDLDGDGSEDLALGAPVAGTVNLCLNASAQSGQSAAADCAGELHSDQGDFFGSSLAIGDLDLDGYADLLAPAPLENSARGEVYLFNGGAEAWTGRRASSQADQRMTGNKEQYAGLALTLADLDQDAQADLVFSDSLGQVFVFYSPVQIDGLRPKDADLVLTDAELGAVWALSAGDIDGDTNPDLVMGFPGEGEEDGAVRILLGSGL